MTNPELKIAFIGAGAVNFGGGEGPWDHASRLEQIKGLRVVGVAPGITLPARGQTPEGFAAAHRATPLQRSSTPEDIAQAVVFVVNAPAITGTTLLVDGGQHLQAQRRDVMFLSRSEPQA